MDQIETEQKTKVKIAAWSELTDRKPAYALVGEVDLVVIRYDDQVSVLFGRCLHRAALMSDGHVQGDNLFCSVHNWDYRIDSGVSEYNNKEALHKFTSWVEDDSVYVDEDENQNSFNKPIRSRSGGKSI